MSLSRRDLTINSLRGGLSFGMGGLTSPFLPKKAMAGTPPKRFALFFLDGGWNSFWATDPVVGDKSNAQDFDQVYKSRTVSKVPGKGNLLVGPGWADAVSAFSAVPTCFINGLEMDITAHDIARELMVTGLSSSLRSDAEAAVVTAHLAENFSVFPEHVILSGDFPLKGVKIGLSGSDIKAIGELLRSPTTYIPDEAWLLSLEFTKKLNQQFRSNLSGRAKETSEKWDQIQDNIFKNSAKKGALIEFSADIQNRYQTTKANSVAGLAAGAFLTLQSDLSHNVAVSYRGFDTHSNEIASQLPKQQEVARAVATFLLDLAVTPDPLAPSLNLIDTTMVFITSEFTRTPQINGASGTDHMPTASAIFCGRGVIDNRVIGKTSPTGMPLAWDGGKAFVSAKGPYLTPKDLIATILRVHDLRAKADKLSSGHIHGIFYG